MSYTKQHFLDGQILKAEQLNHMEDGIDDAMEAIGNVEIALESILMIQAELIGGEEA